MHNITTALSRTKNCYKVELMYFKSEKRCNKKELLTELLLLEELLLPDDTDFDAALFLPLAATALLLPL